MALNTSKYNHLTLLQFTGLKLFAAVGRLVRKIAS